MFEVCKLSSKCSVYVPSVQSISQEYILYPKRINYLVSALFTSQVYSLYPKSTIYVPRLQSMFQDYSLCHNDLVYAQEYSLYTKS